VVGLAATARSNVFWGPWRGLEVIQKPFPGR
jgi:hypothetical protein